MKKCPVCGVEHSDIVTVCSICGSPLTEEALLAAQKAAEAAAAEAKAKAEAAASSAPADFSVDDIQAAISDLVSSSVDSQKSEAPVEEDSPFVINAMGGAKKSVSPASGVSTPKSAPKRAPVGGKLPPRPRKQEVPTDVPAEPERTVMDTTVIAAASAQKVHSAKRNAEAARAASKKAAAKKSASSEEEFGWSERKHKRGEKKKSSGTPVFAAVCALLGLLIIAMLIFLAKMVLAGDNADQPAAPNTSVTQDAEQGEDTEAPSAQDLADLAQQEAEEAEQAQEQELIEDQEDPDAAAIENNEEGEQGTDADTAEPTDTDSTEPEVEDPDAPEDAVVTPPAELPAITEVNDTVYATAPVNVRDYPGTDSSNVISVLAEGQEVKRTGTTANGWSRIDLNGTVGYVSNKYLTTNKPGEGSGTPVTVAYVTDDVNVRDVPSGNIIATLPKGTQVTLTGVTSGNWTQVSVNGVTGYVFSKYLSGSTTVTDPDTKPETKPEDIKVTETGDTVYATAGVNVRDYPSSDGNVITVLSKGQAVTRIGTTGNWSKIKIADIVGYVSNKYLSTSKNGGDSSDDSGSSPTNNGYILPNVNSKYYTQSELSSLSSSQLRLARNEIYARHGRKFNDSSLQSYFNNCSWYKGKVDPATFDANITSYLNDYELANLNLITSME